jgi:LPS-assembly lipoprotein
MWWSELLHAGGRSVGGGVDLPRRAGLAAALLVSGGLASCGFRLRGAQQLPFDSVFVAAPHTSALKPELEAAIRTGTSTAVLEERAKAKAVVEIVSETRERDVLSVNAQGRAREYRLRLRVVFRVNDGKGREYLGQTTVATNRDLAVLEEQLLAREYEAEQLYQDMLYDLAQQILRRMSALKT